MNAEQKQRAEQIVSQWGHTSAGTMGHAWAVLNCSHSCRLLRRERIRTGFGSGLAGSRVN